MAASNEKIEGFFDVCRIRGLTGKQGVLIPIANVRNLILRPDVITAVETGQFHIYPIRTIDDGIALLTGVRAGTTTESETVNGLVNTRLQDLATGLKAFSIPTSGTEAEQKKTPEDNNHQIKEQAKG